MASNHHQSGLEKGPAQNLASPAVLDFPAECNELNLALLEMSHFPICLTRQDDNRYLMVNTVFCKIIGCRRDEIIGRTIAELGFFSNPDDPKEILEILAREGEVKNFQRRMHRKNAAPDQLNLWIKKIRYQNQDCLLTQITYSSPEMDVQKALHHRDKRFHAILNSIHECYYEIDLDGNFTFFNDSLAALFQCTADELMGLSFSRYTRPEDQQRIKKTYRDIFQGHSKIELLEYSILRKDGIWSQVEASASLLRDGNDRPIGYYGFLRDRTEQKKAEEALRESEEQYRQLVNNANDGIYITHQGKIKFHNPKTSQITGYSDEELAGLSFVHLVHPDDRHTIYNAQQQKLDRGETPEVFTFRILNQSNEIKWVELNAIAIAWEGQPATLNFMRDVTKFKKTEKRLHQAQKMEAIGTLAGGIAHDFNNILYAMMGFADLALEDAPQGTPLEENLQDTLRAGKRAKELVRQILTFARQSEEKTEPVLASAIAKEALKLIRSSIPSTIEVQTGIEDDIWIMGNPTQVHQIIMNLCTNAAHAMADTGGVLTVELDDADVENGDADDTVQQMDGLYTLLSITDTGSGIAPENLATIFEPYFTTKALGEGTGMGLSVVQGIVQSYGGKISVHSELGKGTTFKVLLPTAIEHGEYASVEPGPVSSGRGRILLVDDEPAITKMGSRTLQRQGYAVTVSNSSPDALQLFRENPHAFDLVITDMTMPKITGDRLAKEMLMIRPGMPIVICTGYSSKSTEEDALKLGVKAYIYKPMDRDELANTVRKVIGGDV